jgi:hypothetical protein
MKLITFLFLAVLPFFGYTQKKSTSFPVKEKPFTCTTFVYNLTIDEMKIKDICFEVIKGEYTNMNEYSSIKKKENEHWRFEITIKDNTTLSGQNYKAAFYVYEDGSEITQYHPFVYNDEFKAVIYDKLRNSWQILLYQNEEYKILSSYSGYHYTNAFDIKPKRKSTINY